jgi:hypothetical protein
MQRIGGRRLRYATGSNNLISQMFGARTGFTHICDFRAYHADASADFAQPDRLTVDDEAQLWPWLDAALLRSAHGIYPCLWKWRALSRARLRAHLEAGQCYALREGSHLRAWAICLSDPASDVSVLHLDGVDHVSVVAMAQAMRRVASDANAQTVDGLVLSPSPALAGLSEAGYHLNEFTMWIMELEFA